MLNLSSLFVLIVAGLAVVGLIALIRQRSLLVRIIGFIVAAVAFASGLLRILDYFGIKYDPGERVCIVRESGASVFDEPVIIPIAADAILTLPPGAKVYVTGEVSSLPLHEISKIEADLGPEGVQLGPVTVTEVMSNSPAEQAGIRKGDIVIAIDGITVDTQDFVREYVSGHLGRSISMQLQRVDQLIIVEVTPTIIEGMPKIGVAFEGGRPTGVARMPVHGYVPTFQVDCNP